MPPSTQKNPSQKSPILAGRIEHHPPVAQADDAREMLPRQLHLMQAAHQRGMAMFGFMLQHLQGLQRQRGIECRQGFINQKSRSTGHQQTRHAATLTLAAGQTIYPRIQFALQIESRQRVMRDARMFGTDQRGDGLPEPPLRQTSGQHRRDHALPGRQRRCLRGEKKRARRA